MLNRVFSQKKPPPDRLWRLGAKDLWRFFIRQPPSFWLVSFYLFIEYVRPQQVWRTLDVLPWGQFAILGTLAALFIEGRVPRFRTALSWLYLAFIGIVLASSVMAVNPEDSWEMIQVPISWFLVFLLITNIVNNERRFLVFMGFFLLWSFKMSQHGFRSWLETGFGFRDWGATGAPGWFHNSGEFGIQMCVFFPLTLAFFVALFQFWDKWLRGAFLLLPMTAVASMIASSSRGALVGGAAVVAWLIGRSRFRARAAIYGTLLVATVIIMVPQEQKERFLASGEDRDSVERLRRWENGIEIANEYPVLGIGFNNWLRYHENRYGGGLSHNIFIEAWSEMGYVGLFSFLSLIVGTFWVNRGTRRIGRSLGEHGRLIYQMGHGLDGALVGYLASGFFVTVLHYPYFWINLAMVVSLRTAAERKARELASTPTPLGVRKSAISRAGHLRGAPPPAAAASGGYPR
jgi:O-antigen ligase